MSFILGVLLLASASNPTDSATSSQAVQTPGQHPTVDAGKADKGEKKICRREESPESRIGGKQICLTADQWRRVQREQ